jgi:hypothetical protein
VHDAQLVVRDVEVAARERDDGCYGGVGEGLREEFLADVAGCAGDYYFHSGGALEIGF